MGGAKDDAGGRRFSAVGIVACSFVAIFLLASGIPALSVPVDYLEFNDTNATIGSGSNPDDPTVNTSGNGSSQSRIGGEPDQSESAQSAGDEERFGNPPPNRTREEAVQFTVQSEAPAYWRVAAYDVYVQDGWRRSGRPPDWEPDPSNTTRTLLSHEITLRIPAVVLPVAWRPVGVSNVTGPDAAFGTERSVVLEGTADPNETYAVTSLRPETDPAVLDGAGERYPADVEERYTALPESVPDRVSTRTDNITSGAESPYETAVAIEQWFRSNYEYRMNRSAVTNDTAAEVLFERERAHSSTLATTMTVMLRTEGIPARYVKGYTPGVPNETNDTYVVRSVHQHSWVEVYFPEAGWVPFDPTSGDERRALIGEQTDTESGMRYLDHGNRSFGQSADESGERTANGSDAGAPDTDGDQNDTSDPASFDEDANRTRDTEENGTETGEDGTGGEGANADGSDTNATSTTNGTEDGTQGEDGSPRSGGDEQNDSVESNQTDDEEPGTQDSGNTEGSDGTDGDDTSGASGQNQSQEGSQDGETAEEGGTDGTQSEDGESPDEERDSTQSQSGDGDGSQSGGDTSAGGEQAESGQGSDGEQGDSGGDSGTSDNSEGATQDEASGGSGSGGSESGSDGDGSGSSGAPSPSMQNREFQIQLVDEPVPGQPLRVRVVSEEEPVPEARVRFDDESVGTTNESGIATGTVPFEGSLNITVYPGGPREELSDDQEPIASRNVSLPTTIDIGLEGDAYAGTDVGLNATIEGHPVPDGDVSVADQLAARTNRSGLATARLPETTGNVTISVERGAASGERTVELPPIAISTDARPVPLPGRPLTVTVEHTDGTPVADAAVILDGDRVASTDDRGKATISPGASYESRVVAARGDWRTATSINPLRNLLVGVGSLLVVSLLAGAVARALGRAPLRFLRSAPVAIASRALVGLIFLSRLVDILWSAVVRALTGVFSSEGLLPALGAGLAAVRARIAEIRAALAAAVSGLLGSSTESGENGSREAAHAIDGGGPVRRAWGLLLGAVGVSRPVTSTPREIANRAISAGLPTEPVETILEAFRTVEYGRREPDDSRLAAVREAAESVRSDEE